MFRGRTPEPRRQTPTLEVHSADQPYPEGLGLADADADADATQPEVGSPRFKQDEPTSDTKGGSPPIKEVPMSIRRLYVTSLTLVLLATACGARESTIDTRIAADTTSTSEVRPIATTDVTQPVITLPPLPPVSMGTSEAPLPVGQGSPFVYRDQSTAWGGYLSGLLATDAKETGACLVLLGSMNAIDLAGGLVSDSLDTPAVSLMSNGQFIDPGFGECQVEDIELLEYAWIHEASITMGTTFPFYVEFYFPGGVIPKLGAVVLGDATTDNAFYYEPTTISAAPLPSVVAGPSLRNNQVVRPVGPDAPFVYDEWGTIWSGYVEGLVVTPLGPRASGGTCVAVVGSLIPTDTGDTLFADSYSAPTVSLLVDGRLVGSSFGECDLAPLESEGYSWILSAEVAEGTEYLFYQEFYFSGTTLPKLDLLIIGSAVTGAASLYEPTIIRY